MRALKATVIWVLAMAMATAGLLGVNWLVRKALGNSFGDSTLLLWLGLVFALLVYAVLFKLASRLLRRKRSWLAAGLTSLGFLACLPAFLIWVKGTDGPEIRAQAIPGRIDLVVVAPGPLREIGSRPPAPPGDLSVWDVRYTVVVPSLQGDDLDPLVAGSESRGLALRALRTAKGLESPPAELEWRDGAQRAVVLLAKGPRPDSSLVAAGKALDAPRFVLRPDSDVQGPTPIDSALRLVTQTRNAIAERRLAYAYRPLLFFDKRELFDWPVDVDSAFTEGAVTMCEHGGTGDSCEEVQRGVDLDQSRDYIKVEAERFSVADLERSSRVAGSTYYYRVVKRKNGASLIDYWWYLPYNPSLSAWMCSPGLGLPEFSCFDHESDWEGVTVEVGAGGGPPRAVYYAQHANVARHPWAELMDGWAGLEQSGLVEAGDAYHPLVFVARASHAAYRNPCQALFCRQYGSVLPEGRFGGRGAWPGNDDELCASRCLKPLPATRTGEPATWNAFGGPWGTQTCILEGTFCDRGEAPHAPAFQWRYEHPAVARS